jgi:hypothetical protein
MGGIDQDGMPIRLSGRRRHGKEATQDDGHRENPKFPTTSIHEFH